MYIIDTRYMPCLNMLSGCLWGSRLSLSVSIMSGILKLWPPHLIILAPLSRQQSGKAPCWSDLFCHMYLSPHEPGSLIAELCASTVHSQRHQNRETLLSLLFSSLLGFWPLKLVCLGEFLHVMLLSWLCDYYKYLWVTNVWWSSESFSPWEWAMCTVHSQAPIRGADICVWG